MICSLKKKSGYSDGWICEITNKDFRTLELWTKTEEACVRVLSMFRLPGTGKGTKQDRKKKMRETEEASALRGPS
jgi:hypothetical protein